MQSNFRHRQKLVYCPIPVVWRIVTKHVNFALTRVDLLDLLKKPDRRFRVYTHRDSKIGFYTHRESKVDF
jgi:hypothetical protein